MPPAPARYLVRLTLRASEDLRGIFDYIAAHSPRNAAGFIERLLDAIDDLNRAVHILNVRHGARWP